MNYTVYTVLVAALFLSSAMAGDGPQKHNYVPASAVENTPKGQSVAAVVSPDTKPADKVEPRHAYVPASAVENTPKGQSVAASASQEPVNPDWMVKIAHSVCVYKQCIDDPKSGFECKKESDNDFRYYDKGTRVYTAREAKDYADALTKLVDGIEKERDAGGKGPELIRPPGASEKVSAAVPTNNYRTDHTSLPEIPFDEDDAIQSKPAKTEPIEERNVKPIAQPSSAHNSPHTSGASIGGNSQLAATVSTSATKNQPDVVKYWVTMWHNFIVTKDEKDPRFRLKLTCSYEGTDQKRVVSFYIKSTSGVTTNSEPYCKRVGKKVAGERAHKNCNRKAIEYGITQGCCQKAKGWFDTSVGLEDPQCKTLESLEKALIDEAKRC